MTEKQILERLLDLIEQAEYTGRQDGMYRATRSQRRADEYKEMAEVSGKYVRQKAAALAKELTEDDEVTRIGQAMSVDGLA